MKITQDDISRLHSADADPPDSTHLVNKFEKLQHQVETVFTDRQRFRPFSWRESPRSPYIGPPDAHESEYVWLGVWHETYRPLGKPSKGLQLEFGVDVGSARGFFGREVLCGLYFGPWGSDSVASDIAHQLREQCSDLATFLADHPAFVLVTKEDTWRSPSKQRVSETAETLAEGFAITADLTFEDIYATDDVTDLVCESFQELVPLYLKLAGIDRSEMATRENVWESHSPTEQPNSSESQPASTPSATPNSGVETELTVESVATDSSIFDADSILASVETLTRWGASRDEALGYFRRYATDVERGDGFYTVKGLGLIAGYLLSQAGITTLEELKARSVSELTSVDGLREGQAKTIFEDLHDQEQFSPDPAATDCQPTEDRTGTVSEPASHDEDEEEPPGEPSHGIRASRRSDSELPAVNYEGQAIVANPLSEYYEALRSVRKVLSTVMQLDGTGIEPDDLTDPFVQYYVMINACIEHGNPQLQFAGYGPQHNDRLPFAIKDYRAVFGDGNWVTEYHTIPVEAFCNETRTWLTEHTWLHGTNRFVRPAPLDGTTPIPESVHTTEELEYALSILDQFPAYPALPTEEGASDRTIPVETLYTKLFDEVDPKHTVDIDTISGPGQASGDPITGPVAEATPTSQADAESILLDYGKLTHLFQKVIPPSESPARQSLPVFGLDWYRPKSASFHELQELAKHGSDEPIPTFRGRLQDMVHRRFLRDRWDYDYITVFPGHKAGSLSPQLVELAGDAVDETSIMYSPMLERTETASRQREKSREERAEVVTNPSETLRARAKLDGETVILFDDIITSGSSLLAGTHLLREAGAGRVIGLTLGFTPGVSDTSTKEIKKPDVYASEIIAGIE